MEGDLRMLMFRTTPHPRTQRPPFGHPNCETSTCQSTSQWCERHAKRRSRYWLVKGRAFVKKIVNQCIICRKFEGSPFHGSTPPPLPTFRLREDPPFTYTGVDFAGPLYIKTGSTATSPKVWICLYTCCVTRAIHLDVVPDLTTAAFIRSLKRFSSRRGLPHMFVSDNGKTFKAAVKTINAMLQHKEIQGYLSGVGIEWLFNLERAPWRGGVFERMVRKF